MAAKANLALLQIVKMVDAALVMRNWYIGKRIDEEVFAGEERAQYGAEVIARLSRELTGIYGKGFSKRALYQCLRVYRMFPEIVHEARAQLGSSEKVHESRTQSGLLSWTHYRILIGFDYCFIRDLSPKHLFYLPFCHIIWEK